MATRRRAGRALETRTADLRVWRVKAGQHLRQVMPVGGRRQHENMCAGVLRWVGGWADEEVVAG